ncbi:metallo-beta-lactamase domain-containing protein 1 isoform X1 [Hippoglossus stenolepis]|uniref:metallo-beta-lactamase domain-containing protein 1 isoform X1 n=1 Tax=Hippoglossus stenolepis TaxID=195615 RepID=UPI00159C352F|nr:metallo-beta-lactamase domain-containing protein 1 isoform X1 [Hippoglossus stenolepis]
MEVAVMCSSGSAPLEDSADMSGTGSVLVSVSDRYQTIPLPEPHAHFPGQPYSVSVLKVGYCLPQPDGTFRADGTITLITGPKIILVDTGGPWDRDFLLTTLKERGLDPGDINLVVGTHGHSDHIGNLGLFPTALTIVGYDISEGDTYRPNRLAQGHAYTVDEHVSVTSSLKTCALKIYVVPSPGHTGQDVSVQVKGTTAGTVLVAGDLFECCSDGDSWRDLSMNTAVQEVSRQRALRTADVIIPGHGPPFRVLRNC